MLGVGSGCSYIRRGVHRYCFLGFMVRINARVRVRVSIVSNTSVTLIVGVRGRVRTRVRDMFRV